MVCHHQASRKLKSNGVHQWDILSFIRFIRYTNIYVLLYIRFIKLDHVYDDKSKTLTLEYTTLTHIFSIDERVLLRIVCNMLYDTFQLVGCECMRSVISSIGSFFCSKNIFNIFSLMYMAIPFKRMNSTRCFLFHHIPLNFIELHFYPDRSGNKHLHLCIFNITCVWVWATRYDAPWRKKISNNFTRFIWNGKFFELSVTLVFDIYILMHSMAHL